MAEDQFLEYPGSLLACERAVIRRDLRVGSIASVNGGGIQIALGALVLGSVNLPAIAAGPLNNYAPPVDTSQAFVLSFQCSGAPGTVSITGLDLGAPGQLDGRLVCIQNRLNSTKTLQIEHENAGSNPTNRFVNGSTGGARALGAGGSALYVYNVGGSNRWVLLAAASL